MALDPQIMWVVTWNDSLVSRYWDAQQGLWLVTGMFNEEYSADIEPMAGGYGDLYYYQTMSNIRRFKGVRQVEAASGAKTIAIDGEFADWSDVFPEFRDNIGPALNTLSD